MSLTSFLYEMSGFWFKRNERRCRKPSIADLNNAHLAGCSSLSVAMTEGPGTECPCFRCPFGLRRNVADLRNGETK